jgi:hypothetical protein
MCAEQQFDVCIWKKENDINGVAPNAFSLDEKRQTFFKMK